ncbi:YeeE/YedE family protein [Basilea psittacipulmonis]|uniref:YeeE/YedE family protein n=1 Tax=Basilea psittacipulmonis TaxID=1472345 RepID=UPI0006924585|nr:YeeE/YedE family protein [Basilea psittacipulmonis]
MILTGLLCGAILGFVLQRGRFCVTGALRDLYLLKKSRMFIAFLLVIAIQSVGIYVLLNLGIIKQNPAEPIPLIATIAGGLMFGIGIVLAGGCATGTWYRSGEGLVGSWIALFMYMLFSAIMRTGPLGDANRGLKSIALGDTFIYETLGISSWILLTLFVLLVAYLLIRELSKPKAKIAELPPKRTGIAHFLFEKRWHPFFTATLIGVIAIVAWPLSIASGRNFGLGITTPSANLIQYLVTADTRYINWGVLLVIGILIGSFIAAKASGEFRVRVPDTKTIISSLFGGVLMGIGASLAGGCTVGNGMVETALFSWQGWISLLFFTLGTWIAAYFTIVRPQQKSLLNTQSGENKWILN